MELQSGLQQQKVSFFFFKIVNCSLSLIVK